MAQHKRGIPRTQTTLLPPTLEDYAGRHSVARVIDAYVNGVDVVALGFKKSVAADTGRRAYAPDDLLRLYLYGYWNRICASRKLEVECQRTQSGADVADGAACARPQDNRRLPPCQRAGIARGVCPVRAVPA